MIAMAATAITLFLLVLAAFSLRPSSRWSVPGGIGSRTTATTQLAVVLRDRYYLGIVTHKGEEHRQA